jgi:hypothetical protein
VFSEADKRMLLFGNNYLWKTIDGGITWTRISDDLTRKTRDAPKSIGAYTPQAQPQLDTNGARVIYTIGPSPIDANRLWIGTDDGVIQTTADGGLHWTDVTPPQIGSYWKVFMMDAGRFDGRTAYAAVNTLRIDDMRPHIYRTLDAGKTWTEIVTGMNGAGPANAVREDPRKRGLLYASTETGVYVSFDNGDHWQSLRLNLPPSSVRDLIVKDDDVAVATHGRRFWILDDVTPLRQIDTGTAGREVVLFKPAAAWRVRWNLSSDMPWPKDEPTLPNPPEGAPINFYLRGAATGAVTLEVLSADGKLVRRYSSTDALAPVPGSDTATVPIPLVPAAAAVADGRGRSPVSLGLAVSAAGRGRRRARRSVHCRDPVQQRTRAVDAAGRARHVHREADGERTNAHAGDDGQTGPAREDAGARHAAGVLAHHGHRLRRDGRARRAGARAKPTRAGGGARCQGHRGGEDGARRLRQEDRRDCRRRHPGRRWRPRRRRRPRGAARRQWS